MLAVALGAGAVAGCSSVETAGDPSGANGGGGANGGTGGASGGSSAGGAAAGEVKVNVSNLTGSKGKVLILFGMKPNDMSQLFTACESITTDPASTSTLLRIHTEGSPCETGGVAKVPAGALQVFSATMTPGEKVPLKCASADATVNGNITVDLPELDEDCSGIPIGD